LGEGVLKRPFSRVDGELCCGGVRAADLAERFGTPLYVYDVRRMEERVRAFHVAFRDIDHLIAYSVKANGNLSILRRLSAAGCGADITSRGELFRALRAGIAPGAIVFAGVGKTKAEIAAALEEGIYAFNVESAGELERSDEVAAE
jgi:diaminopimelate decarboxylase